MDTSEFKSVNIDPTRRWFISADLIINNELKELVEIGASKGDHPRGVISQFSDIKYSQYVYYLIDLPDQEKRQYTAKLGISNKMMDLKTKGLRTCRFFNNGSEASAKLINNVDFVFVDGDTGSREALKKDIDIWFPKINPKGIIAGRYLVFKEGKPTSYIKHLVDDEFGRENINLHLLLEKCSGEKDYYWWYQKGE